MGSDQKIDEKKRVEFPAMDPKRVPGTLYRVAWVGVYVWPVMSAVMILGAYLMGMHEWPIILGMGSMQALLVALVANLVLKWLREIAGVSYELAWDEDEIEFVIRSGKKETRRKLKWSEIIKVELNVVVSDGDTKAPHVVELLVENTVGPTIRIMKGRELEQIDWVQRLLEAKGESRERKFKYSERK